jgi:hypothetical protein
MLRQGPERNAREAAPTATSTSSAPQRGTSAQGLPVKGSKLSNVDAVGAAAPFTILAN